MYYKLYGYKANKLDILEESENEMDIVDEIGQHIRANCKIRFIIVLVTKDQDIPYKTINTIDEYVHYIQQVNETQKEVKKLSKSIKRTVK